MPPDLDTTPRWTWTATTEPPPFRGAYAGREGIYGPRTTLEARSPAGEILAVVWPAHAGGRVCSVRRGIVTLSTITVPIGTPDHVIRDLADTLITLWNRP